MNTPRILLLVLLSALTGAAQAQWQWIDNSGRKVFSDRPPPAGTPERNVQRKPSTAPTTSLTPPSEVQSADASPVATRPASPQRAAGTDPELEKRKAEQEAADARQKQVEEAKQAGLRRQNCERARRMRDTLQSGQLLAHTSAQGQREFMGEDTRRQEMDRANEAIQRDCQS